VGAVNKRGSMWGIEKQNEGGGPRAGGELLDLGMGACERLVKKEE